MLTVQAARFGAEASINARMCAVVSTGKADDVSGVNLVSFPVHFSKNSSIVRRVVASFV